MPGKPEPPVCFVVSAFACPKPTSNLPACTSTTMPLINWNEATVEDLHGFTTDFIRHELSRPNLETTGSKDEMIERLLADIAHNRQPSGIPDSTAEQTVLTSNWKSMAGNHCDTWENFNIAFESQFDDRLPLLQWQHIVTRRVQSPTGQLPQANQLKAKKKPDAKASLGSAALNIASSLYELRQQLTHKIEALRSKRPAGSERKANKQAVKPTAEATENKRHKPSQDSPAAASNTKARKAPQPAAAFNRDSHITYSKFALTDSSLGADARPKVAKKKKVARQLEVNVQKMRNLEEYAPGRRAKEAQEKRNWHRALDRAEGIKVRDDPVPLEASLKACEKRRQQRCKKWDSRSQRVKQRQMERQKKRRDIIKTRKQAKLHTKMKRLKKKDLIVPGFSEGVDVLVASRLLG
ncbi:hypothetical protein HPB52_014310 [Rhipicephalus sanguineus]|uniref:SAP domain-containing protein n=1 Tax=Rhipicephalus sanguineus TaxID=34632 RepID=A0A9D4PPV3_RHISA|nr:hypothetical protein HPB52_014310 [Rhipicephalus sanguineus]